MVAHKVCSICGKGQISGNSISHSHIKTRRTWGANLHKVKLPQANGTMASVYVCTRCLRTMKKDAE